MPSRLSASSRTPWQGPRASVRHAKWLVAGCPAPVAIGRLAVVSLPLHLSHKSYKPYRPPPPGARESSDAAIADRCWEDRGSDNGPTRLFTDPAGCWTGAARGGRGRARVALKITAYRVVYDRGRPGAAGALAGGSAPAPRGRHAPAARVGEAGRRRQRRTSRGGDPAPRPFSLRGGAGASPARTRHRPRRITASSPLVRGTRHRMMVG